MVIKLLQKFRCVFILFYLETKSKYGKINLIATIEYTWCAYLSPPLTGVNHYNLFKKSNITLLPYLFVILLAVSIIILRLGITF